MGQLSSGPETNTSVTICQYYGMINSTSQVLAPLQVSLDPPAVRKGGGRQNSATLSSGSQSGGFPCREGATITFLSCLIAAGTTPSLARGQR